METTRLSYSEYHIKESLKIHDVGLELRELWFMRTWGGIFCIVGVFMDPRTWRHVFLALPFLGVLYPYVDCILHLIEESFFFVMSF
jgi:hypothetical protein